MKYYFFPLKPSELKIPACHSYEFVHANEDRFVETDVLIEVNTYDKGTSRLVYNDVVYQIKKDYVDLSGQRRIYIGCPSLEGPEIVGDYEEFIKKMG